MFSAILPALIPSWRFFDFIRPSPRIEIALSSRPDEKAPIWTELRPRPPRLSIRQTLARLLWNPHWNELLYLTTCTEQFLDHQSDEQKLRLLDRITELVRNDRALARGHDFLRLRLIVMRREQGRIVRKVAFVSEPVRLSARSGAAS